MKLNRPRISLAKFKLPFSLDEKSRNACASDNDSSQPSLEEMEAALPEDVVFLGHVDSEIGNWTSWKIDERFYLIPMSDGRFDWALFRISWDDNWCRYEFSFDARISGSSDRNEAARLMLRRLFSCWKIDLRRRRNRPYKDLIS